MEAYAPSARPSTKMNMRRSKPQLNVRVHPLVMKLIQLERASIPGCAGDGAALESIVFRSASSPEARNAIMQAAMSEPLLAAALAFAHHKEE
jgi:hypothetical protein